MMLTSNTTCAPLDQHFNNVYDQQYMENQDSIGFYNCFKGLLDRSIYGEVYSYISIKAHNDEYFFYQTLEGTGISCPLFQFSTRLI